MKTEDLKLANCRINQTPTSLFFEDFESITLKEKYEVLSLCEGCAVKTKCLDEANSKKDTYGVWGGVFFKKGRPVRIASIKESRSIQASS